MMLRDTAQDTRLTFDERGMLAYLLSKPGDWEIKEADLQKAGHCGRDKVRGILDSLNKHGYLTKEHEREKGKFTKNIYTLYETPVTEVTVTEKPSMENQTLTEDRKVQSTEEPISPVGEQPLVDEPEPLEVVDSDNGSWRSIQKAVNDTFKRGNTAMYGVSGDIAHMLLGTAEKATYAEFNFVQPVTVSEVMAFGLWWDKKRDRNNKPLTYPTRPQAILEQFEEFRSSPDYRKHMVSAVRSTEPQQPEQPSAQEVLMARALAAVEVDDGRPEPDPLAA
jgi:hypothetical protein